MGTQEALKHIPAGDFLRVTRDSRAKLPHDKKAALIRKGNELFNRGEIELAKRIFLTAGYSDGLIRLGELYEEKKQPLEAFRMYYAAPHKRRISEMLEQMAGVIQKWLQQDD